MTNDERSIAESLESFLRKRGYATTVTVTHQGGAYFFANSPIKVPAEVWQDAIDDLHIPRWMAVSADCTSNETER